MLYCYRKNYLPAPITPRQKVFTINFYNNNERIDNLNKLNKNKKKFNEMINKLKNSENTVNRITTNVSMLVNPKNTSVSNVNKLYKNITKKLIPKNSQNKLQKADKKAVSAIAPAPVSKIITNTSSPKTSNYAQTFSFSQKEKNAPLSKVVNNYKSLSKKTTGVLPSLNQKPLLKNKIRQKSSNIIQKTLSPLKKPLEIASNPAYKNRPKSKALPFENKKSFAPLKNLRENINVKTPKNSSNINISPNINVELKPQNTLSDFNRIWTEIGNRLNSELNSSANGFH